MVSSNKSGVDSENGLIALEHMMMMFNQQRPQPGLGSPRNCISWLFIFILIIYIFYSSKLILINNGQSQYCSQTSRLSSSTTQKINHLANLTTVTNSSSLTRQQQPEILPFMLPQRSQRFDTQLKHIVFGIAGSSKLWEQRKEYIKTWWRPKETRGVVWLDKRVRTRTNEALPKIRISGDTSKFMYTHHQGGRSALRITRVVSETLRLGMKNVRWFVMGDDDTVFVVENVVRVLSKYDHRQFYYVGSNSESHVQNIHFSYAMAYGGGGFAISYPLAMELEKMQDRCIQRYPGLYGSDDRIQACMAELGVPLTKEPGFHQYDVYGSLLGLLGAHPVTPFLSLHHLDVVQPIIPSMSKFKAIQHLFESIKLDSASIMQQSICYDKERGWSISISWGYVVQIIRGVMSPRELEMPVRTFLNWYPRADYTAYAFNTRPVTRHPCQKPFIFYVSSTTQRKNQIIGVYSRYKDIIYPYCRWKIASPAKIESIVITKAPDPLRWQKSPRRDCCRVLPSRKKTTMSIWVGNCQKGEISEL